MPHAAKPKIYLTNWSSPKLHGPGRKLTIMTHPRHWEKGEGLVPSCRPTPDMVSKMKRKEASWDELREHVLARVQGQGHRPGELWAIVLGQSVAVNDGDTLCCSCSRTDAAQGRCHRAFVAEALVRSGWSVVLDGEELEAQA